MFLALRTLTFQKLCNLVRELNQTKKQLQRVARRYKPPRRTEELASNSGKMLRAGLHKMVTLKVSSGE